MATCHESNRSALPRVALSSLLLLISCAVITGCKPAERASAGEPAAPDTYFPIEIGGKTLHLQLALAPAEHRQGLMFRQELAENHGMLFIFERPQQQGFWMKNTRLPLDIGYLDSSGKLLEVHQLFPYDETPVASRSRQILIAIETNRGWYEKNGVKPGAQLDMNTLKTAIAERGFSPAKYAIKTDD